jgi:hydroxymethylglutaryl-CoA lyase
VIGALTRAGIGLDVLALHLHDTRGTALANVMAALELGVRCFDASTGGTGGSPYAPGSAGNLATEDLVYLLDREGVQTGVDLDGILAAGTFIAEQLGRDVSSKVGRAGGWPRGAG